MTGMIGRTLKHYHVEELLGKGGMGAVYRAKDTRLQRAVALKVLSSDLTADLDRRARFLQEARSAAAISHPAVAQVYDVDEADGITFIAMELVEGETVRQLVTNRDLDVMAALEIAVQVGEGLVKAHELGIVHRDIKSENIMVTREGHAKILDFGLAKLDPLRSHEGTPTGNGEEHLSQIATVAGTLPGMVVGTIAYMSPEQARGRPVDFRSDIFSLGVTLYEMSTGKLPFSGDSPLDTMHAIAFEETRPVTTLRQNLPSELQRIISRCMRKRPEDRYPDARALVTDLRALRKDMDSGISRAMPLAERLRQGISSIRSGAGQWSTPWTLAAIAGAVLLVLAFAFRQEFDVMPGLFFALLGLWLFRRYRVRGPKLMRRFAAKLARMPEVRIVAFREGRATVVVDRMQAKLYLRMNSLMDAVNKKYFHGRPIGLSVRDDVSQDELRRMVGEGGVLYVRDDVFEPK
jgi:eukaryotic-like serine/threonine-protein kinase